MGPMQLSSWYLAAIISLAAAYGMIFGWTGTARRMQASASPGFWPKASVFPTFNNSTKTLIHVKMLSSNIDLLPNIITTINNRKTVKVLEDAVQQ